MPTRNNTRSPSAPADPTDERFDRAKSNSHADAIPDGSDARGGIARLERALHPDQANDIDATIAPSISGPDEEPTAPELRSGGTAGSAGPPLDAQRPSSVGDPMESFDRQRNNASDVDGIDGSPAPEPPLTPQGSTAIDRLEASVRQAVEMVFGDGAAPSTSNRNELVPIADDAMTIPQESERIDEFQIDHVGDVIGEASDALSVGNIEQPVGDGMNDTADELQDLDLAD